MIAETSNYEINYIDLINLSDIFPRTFFSYFSDPLLDLRGISTYPSDARFD